MREKPLVLIVDDSPDFKEIISAKLVAAGYEIAEGANGAEGISKAKALKPDLIIMDIEMPDVNGTEAALEIKNNPDTANVPLVFFSSLDKPWPGMVGADRAEVAKQLGAVTFLSKGDDMTKILQTILDLTKKEQTPK
jgi:twitching motility two-component system response regulator PilH